MPAIIENGTCIQLMEDAFPAGNNLYPKVKNNWPSWVKIPIRRIQTQALNEGVIHVENINGKLNNTEKKGKQNIIV